MAMASSKAIFDRDFSINQPVVSHIFMFPLLIVTDLTNTIRPRCVSVMFHQARTSIVTVIQNDIINFQALTPITPCVPCETN